MPCTATAVGSPSGMANTPAATGLAGSVMSMNPITPAGLSL
jgi:hypothetical protein